MGRVDKVPQVPLGRALEAQLTVGGHRVVHEGYGGGEASVVENLPVVLAKPGVRLGLETELVLVTGAQAVHSANLFKAVDKV